MFKLNDLRPCRGDPLLLCSISPGAGMVGSLCEMVFSRDDRRLSKLGDAPLGDRWRPALIVAAAAREDNEGERGDGGLARESLALIDMRLGRSDSGEVIEGRRGDSEFRSGDIGGVGLLDVSFMDCVGRMLKLEVERHVEPLTMLPYMPTIS